MQQNLQQTINLILDYVRGVWIKKRYLIICSWLVCPAGMFYISLLPDTYESEAKVFVDTRSVLQPLLTGLAIQRDPQQEIDMMALTLLSRQNLEEVARATDLDLTTTNDAEFSELIDNLKRDIRLRAQSRDNIYSIIYRNSEALVAQRVVQEMLNLFVENTLGGSRQDTDTASRFLDTQIAEYENRLSVSEQRLADFKRKYSDLLPGQGSFYGNVQSLKESLAGVDLQIKEVTQQISTLEQKLSSSKPQASGIGVGPADSEAALSTPYDARIDALQQQLDQLKLRYTDFHPDVIETTNLLNAIVAQRDKEIDAYVSQLEESGIVVTGDNPFSSELSLEISKLDGQLASLKVRQADYASKIEIQQSKLDQVPLVEAELTALNRDYGITQQKYEDLLSRRESATLSTQANVSDDDVKFRVIEPPRLPLKPSGPKRILFYTITLFAGFGLGMGIAFIISQLVPVVVRASQVTAMTGVPVLGTVSHINIDKVKRENRIRLFVFIASSSTIFLIFLSFVALDILGINVADKIGEYI